MDPTRRAVQRTKAGILAWSLGFSIYCLVFGIILAARGNSTDCIPFLQWCFFSIFLVFLASFILLVTCMDSANRRRDEDDRDAAIFCHLCVKLLALIVFLCLMIVAFVSVKNMKLEQDGKVPDNLDEAKKMDRESKTPQPIREYNLGDYGGRLRRRVTNDRHYWAGISSCLRRRHACRGMSPLVRDPNTGALLAQRPSKKYPYDIGLSPIESGCCKPPLSCGFTYVNQTSWTQPSGGRPAEQGTDADCGRWNNDSQTLCFECDSCKAGVIADIRRAWGLPVILTTIFLVVQICLWPLALCLFSN